MRIPRLHNALSHLNSYESLAMAFVLGAGLGSILHFFFMLFIISIRTIRYRRHTTREQRREARRTRRAARREGRVRLSEEELPEYVAAEEQEIVEKV
jgi:hypothetical protein